MKKFYGSSKSGEVVVNNSDGMKSYLKSIEGDFEIKVTPTKDIRTLQMNNLYWGWLTALSDYSGYTKQELHNYFKTKLLCENDQINGEIIINCQSTSDLTIKQFGAYLEDVCRISAQNFEFILESRPLQEIL